MRALFGMAAVAVLALASPAQAQSTAVSSGSFASGVQIHVGSTVRWGDNDRRHRGDRRDRRRGFDSVYLDAPEYQGDSIWKAESFNDWWHDRPSRSLPAWVTNNRDCQRQYYSGDTLRC